MAQSKIREILVNLIAFHNSGVPVLKYDIDQAEQAIKGLRLSEEAILTIITDWWEKEKKGKTLSDLAHAIYEAQTRKEEG